MYTFSSISKNFRRSIHEVFQVFLLETPHGYCVLYILVWALPLFAFMQPAHALGVEDLQPAVQEALKIHAFVKPGAPIPAFSWTLEKSRTLRKLTTVTETFTPAANGVATVKVATQSGSKPLEQRERMSLRGLDYIDANDPNVNLTAEALDMPPKSGDALKVTLKKDGQTLIKSCTIGARKPASSLLAQLPGDMASIECTGTGTVKGMKVSTTSQLAWFDALGVFILLKEEASTPLGKFTETAVIKKFSQ
jgi:hypothetical protein